MNHPRPGICTVVVALAIALTAARAWSGQRDGDDKKPSLALKASPPVGFSPLRVRVVVEARGGSNDYADFYCPSIDWDWGDGTVSESSSDCAPYEAGKSEIQRRWTAEHLFRESSTYKVQFTIKQKNRSIAVSTGTIQVRAGIRDDIS